MNTKIYIGIALLIFVSIFIIQNAVVVDIKFLFWKISMSRSLMVFFVLGVGVAVGWIIASFLHKKHEDGSRKD